MTRAPVSVPHDARLLEIAAEHIRRHGVERTTIVSIAREAGMSHGNVYRYFPSKESLLDSITAAWLKPLEASLREIADAPDPARDKIERMLSAIYRAYRGKREDDPNIFALFVDATVQDRAVARRHRARVRAEAQKVVEESASGTNLVVGDVRRDVSLVLDAAYRFTHPSAIDLDAGTPRSQVDSRFERVSRLVRRALTSGPSEWDK